MCTASVISVRLGSRFEWMIVVLSTKCCRVSVVVFVLHVCLDCSCLFVHGQPSGKSGACVPDVVAVLKSTTFKRTVKFVHHVGTHEPLTFIRVVSHDQMLCFGALVIYMKFQTM